MDLIIKRKENEVVVSFAKEKLSINIGDDALENNMHWNTSSINDFLIKLASSLAIDDSIKLLSDESSTPSYNHIVELFRAFSDEYNK